MNKKGYTLIEMILVVAIIGILATVALPIYKKTVAHYRHTAALRMIVTDIRMIQQQSITENTSFSLTFNDSNYQLIRGEQSELKELPEGNHIIGTDFEVNSLSFNPTGEPSKGSGYIIVGDSWGNKNYIFITAATGRVKISDKPLQNGQ